MTGEKFPEISVAIPTYMREQVLLETIDQLLALETLPAEILVVDQTLQHDRETSQRLQRLADSGAIQWLRLEIPSIPAAMNHALCRAAGDVVLFLDDDVELTSEIIAAHAAAHSEHNVALVAGQVVQSWQTVQDVQENAFISGREDDPDGFCFNSARSCRISRFMGGNFSIKKSIALQIGGFDENFVRVAYRFEAEFAARLLAAGHEILFSPDASIRHLKVESGGTRTFGEHLKTILPSHCVGRYYYLLIAGTVTRRLIRITIGPFRAVKTRFHLSHPWWIPLTFFAECSGLVWAIWLYLQGPRYVKC